MRVVVSFTDEHEEFKIDDPIVEPVPVEEKKPIKKKDPDASGDDADDDAAADDQELEDPDADPDAKPKFDPTKYAWSVSNGNPKTLTKILHKKVHAHDVNSLLHFLEKLNTTMNSLN